MNLQEITQRDTNTPLSQDEALFLIEEYIKERKGRTIKAAPPRSMYEIQIMHHLSHAAKDWFISQKR